MEHLLLPRGSKLTEEDKVPCLCHDDYDCGSFLEYPQRRPLHFIEVQPYPVLYRISPHVKNPEPISLGAVLQDWLFFGLLFEFLGDLFRSSDFKRAVILHGIHHARIDTQGLPDLIDRWLEPTRTSPIPDSRFQHLALCLSVTHGILRNAARYSNMNQNVWLSLALTADLLCAALQRISSHKIPEVNFGTLWKFVQTDSMSSRGWCAYEAGQLQQYPWVLQTYFFLSRLNRPATTRDHRECSKEDCVYSQRCFEMQSAALHVSPNCNCGEEIVIDGENLLQIIAILEKRCIPLLKIDYNSELDHHSVQVVSSGTGAEYIAVSHVWADGLGNSSKNSSKKCRLVDLYRMQSQVQVKTKNPELLLWIDTLCCPTEPATARELALGLMRMVYINASHVLVLDAELRLLEASESDIVEILLLVLTSGWMRRLWTYQEGSLANNLWIQFVNGPRNMQNMINTLLMRDDSCNVQLYSLGRDILGKIRRLRRFVSKKQDEGVGLPLALVRSAVQDRSVSVHTDEALCIGALMSLDVEQLAAAAPEDRMRKLWDLVSYTKDGIPKSVIFGTSPRLNVKGYRWAPATFLCPDKVQSLATVPNFDEPQQLSSTVTSTLAPDGLNVRFSGFLLETLAHDSSLKSMRKTSGPGQFRDMLHLQDPFDRWFGLISLRKFENDTGLTNMGITDSSLREIEEEAGIADSALHDMIQDDSNLLGVILRRNMQRDPVYRKGCPGLLVKVVRRSSESNIVHTQRHVFLSVYEESFGASIAKIQQEMRREEHEGAEQVQDAPETRHGRNRVEMRDGDISANQEFVTSGSFARISEWFPDTQSWCVD